MPTVALTLEIDADLKASLEEIAHAQNCSLSDLIGRAFEDQVEERRATRALVETGLMLVEQGAPGIDPEDIRAWMLAEDGSLPFPKPRESS